MRHIIDITNGNPAGYEADETSQAKDLIFDVLEDQFISDYVDAILATDIVVEALIKAGWRPTVENADTGDTSAEPSDSEIEAVADVLEGLDGCDFTTVARAALLAAREAARHE